MFCKFSHSFVFKKDNRNSQLPDADPEVNNDEPTNLLCELCGQLFGTQGHFDKHIEDNHKRILISKVQHFKCRECSFVVPTRIGLNSHVIQNHEKTDIECEQCGKFFVSSKELRDHRKTHNSVDQSIESISNMLKHLLDKDERTLHVVEDVKIVGTKTSFKKLREQIHETHRFEDESTEEKFLHNSRKLECGMCVLEFQSVEDMDNHMDENHEGRWKINDPDVVYKGEYYDENASDNYDTDFDDDDSVTENSETQSGEE